ncbi:hypothetical protein Y032_0291g1576 [Ancylostoma ceylanicum]|uniref:Uncharacterized protein n=1 Tax=Ancylostoma ceylanicum TaxID=53326 RepID=A0A016S6A9_9BILA|nr:hypothetical protein Y032_0291g1576 [Ancylostoma ceylanicum]
MVIDNGKSIPPLANLHLHIIGVIHACGASEFTRRTKIPQFSRCINAAKVKTPFVRAATVAAKPGTLPAYQDSLVTPCTVLCIGA